MMELMKVMTSGGTHHPPKDTSNDNANPKPRVEMDPRGYCWTHGFKTNKNHNSKN